MKMKLLRGLAMLLVVVVAILAIVDLMDSAVVRQLDDPFTGALALMLLGIGLAFFLQKKNQG